MAAQTVADNLLPRLREWGMRHVCAASGARVGHLDVGAVFAAMVRAVRQTFAQNGGVADDQ
jgi:hypothetical protein